MLSAYRNIPIHPDERHLLGMFWRDNFYVDLTLPFGFRSAPFIFDSVVSMVGWILRTNYHIRLLFHYLDDFHQFGLPLYPGKCKGPSSTLVFLGIELDSVAQIARLPPHKFAATIDLSIVRETVVYREVVGIAHWFPSARLQEYPPMDRRSCIE